MAVSPLAWFCLGVGRGGSCRCCYFCFWVVFPVLFVRFFLSSRWLRWCFWCPFWALVFGWVLVGCFGLVFLARLVLFVAAGVPWFLRLLAFVLRSLLFVRFPRPWFVPPCAWGCRRSGAGVGWFCCPLSALSSVRRRCCVWAVRPAVVSRRSGALLFVWVFSSGFAPSGG